MRNLYLKEKMQNSSKASPFQHRSRLRSLKQLRHIPTDNIDGEDKLSQQRIFEIIQKKMIQDNQKLQNEQVLDNIKKTYPLKKTSKHTEKQQLQKKLTNLKQGNKLFQYFEELYKKQIPAEKVQRQKINFIEKQFEEMKTKVQNKQELSKLKLFELKQNLRKKYLQLHKYHEQRKDLDMRLKQQIKSKIKQEKSKKSVPQNKSHGSQVKKENQGKSTLINLKPPSLKQKLYILDDTINYMKAQITKIEQEIENINTKENFVQQQWINFLKIFINCGYYMSNGLDNILMEMKNMKVNLTKEDLVGDILDEKSKNYLLRYYQNSAQQNKQKSNIFIQGNESKNFGNQRKRIKSNIEMKSLIKDSNLKEIYSNTREAMTNLLKRSSFRKSPESKDNKESFFPKIQVKKQFMTKSSRSNTIENDNQSKVKQQVSLSEVIQQQKKQQINRINHLYFGNGNELQTKGKLIKRILFGFNAK